MKFSLIIPVYNSEKFLEKLLLSIFKQNYKNYEVIIINDGSTDNSEKIIKKYGLDPRVKEIYIENSGPGAARRIGFNNATGNLLFFIDSDDYLPDNKILEKIANIYEEKKFDMLIFNYISKLNNKETITNAFSNTRIKEGIYDSNFLKKNRLGGALWQKIFVKDKMALDCFCNNNNFEDYYTTYKYLNNNNKIYYTKEVCYYANRDNINSLSKKYNKKKIIDTINILEDIYSFSIYKDVIITIVCNYYAFCKYNMRKFNLTNKEEDNINIQLRRLNKIIKVNSLFKVKRSFKCFMKLVYVRIGDVIKNI